MNKQLSAQTGLVLPLVLIFLVIMMLLGTAVIRNVSLEEKMAANMRNRNLAFQAAEQALRFCENSVQQNTLALNSITVQTEGPFTSGPNAGKDYWDVDSSWRNAAMAAAVPRSAGEVSANAAQLQQRPQCMVELMTRPIMKSTSSAGDDVLTGNKKFQFRITARGVGLDANTVVKLQSYLIM